MIAVLLLFVLTICGCGDRLHNKDLVQQAVLKRLQTRSGLDLNAVDVTTTSVTFDKNMAYAMVSFHPKGDPGVNSGLVMKYTLQERDGAWDVVSVGDSKGAPLSGHMGMGQMPAGHPGSDGLPAGHPPVDSGSQGSAQ